MKPVLEQQTIVNYFQKTIRHWPFLLLFILYVIVLFRTAWMCDDAFITLRTVDNFINGFGLTWNVSERVQVYTHPLWMFFLSALYAITEEPFVTVIIASIILCSAAILILISTGQFRPHVLLLPMSLFIMSRSFVDYSTSGLEQPMIFFLSALFIKFVYQSELTKNRAYAAVAVSVAVALTRTDCILLFIPTLIVIVLKYRSAKFFLMSIAIASPLLLWHIFSLFYYGFLAPNTAFVKLGHGLPKSMIFEQGLFYLAESFKVDPITLSTVAAGLLSTVFPRSRKYAPLSIGVLLYIIYIVYIGGDFMSGRFFAVPFFFAVYLLVRFFENLSLKIFIPAVAASLIVGFLSPHPTVFSGPDFGKNRKTWGDLIDKHGIADERGFWYGCAGWFSDRLKDGLTDCGRKNYASELNRQNKTFIEAGGVGFLGYYAGPGIYIFDTLGITDALLARLQCKGTEGWRPGHYPKHIPAGYKETLETGVNSIKEDNFKKYYEVLNNIIAGELWNRQRFSNIWKMNTGVYDNLIPKIKLIPPKKTVNLQSIKHYENPRFPIGSSCSKENMMYYKKPMVFALELPINAGGIEFAANDDAEYLVQLKKNEKVLSSHKIPSSDELFGKIRKHCIKLEKSDINAGLNRFHFEPRVGNHGCFSYIRTVESCEE